MYVCASLPDYLSVTHFILIQHICTLIVLNNILIPFDTIRFSGVNRKIQHDIPPADSLGSPLFI